MTGPHIDADLEAVRASARYRTVLKIYRVFWLVFAVGMTAIAASLAYLPMGLFRLLMGLLVGLLLSLGVLGQYMSKPFAESYVLIPAGGNRRAKARLAARLNEAIFLDLIPRRRRS